jgi:hypothetical protein
VHSKIGKVPLPHIYTTPIEKEIPRIHHTSVLVMDVCELGDERGFWPLRYGVLFLFSKQKNTIIDGNKLQRRRLNQGFEIK